VTGPLAPHVRGQPQDEEFLKARQLLIDGGMSGSKALETLTKRWRQRDEFAAGVLQAIIIANGPGTSSKEIEEDANTAYIYANAMLQRRNLP
jgi:hypothetical protein